MQDAPPIPPCPRGYGAHVVRNGRLRSGARPFPRRGCGRRFVADPTRGPVPDERKGLARRLRRERMSLRGVARATGLSRSWLQGFVHALGREGDAARPRAAQKESGPLTLEADEVWSSVGGRADVRRVWAALDADPRQVVAMVCGGRDGATARCRWDAPPDEYRGGAEVATDFLAAYRAVVPEGRRAAAGEDAGLTAHAERFRRTLRQRVGRCARKTLSFPKRPDNHVGALWDFIRHDNASLL